MSGSKKLVKSDIRVLVDDALRADKNLIGSGMWVDDNREHCKNWARLIEIDGEIQNIQLLIKYHTNDDNLKFRILLNVPQCVWRMDFADEDHPNPLNAPFRPGEIISGPHYHSWADNRQYAHANILPKKLHSARPLHQEVGTFQSAYRWFCQQTNIQCKDAEIPTLPVKDRLI